MTNTLRSSPFAKQPRGDEHAELLAVQPQVRFDGQFGLTKVAIGKIVIAAAIECSDASDARRLFAQSEFA